MPCAAFDTSMLCATRSCISLTALIAQPAALVIMFPANTCNAPPIFPPSPLRNPPPPPPVMSGKFMPVLFTSLNWLSSFASSCLASMVRWRRVVIDSERALPTSLCCTSFVILLYCWESSTKAVDISPMRPRADLLWVSMLPMARTYSTTFLSQSLKVLPAF